MLLEEEDDSHLAKNQAMFELKHITFFFYFCHLFEPIDWLYLVIGTIGLLACCLCNPILNYINANVYSEVGNTSEDRDSLDEIEIMELIIKDTMNSNIKQQIIIGTINLVGNILEYFL